MEIKYEQGRRVIVQAPQARIAPKPFVSRGARVLALAAQGVRAAGVAPNGIRLSVGN